MIKFKYGDEIKVISGFWKGYVGIVNDCRNEDEPYETEYEVSLIIDNENDYKDNYKDDYKEITIKERKLRKCIKANLENTKKKR